MSRALEGSAPAKAHLAACLRRLRFEAASALAEQRGRPEAERTRIDSLAAEARAEEERLRAAGAGGKELPLVALARRLGLRPLDETLLLAAVGLEVDPLYAITLSALAGEEPRQGVSAKLVAQLCRFAGDESLTLGLDGGHPLVASGLLETSAPPTTPDALKPWRAATRAIAWLGGSDALDPVLARAGEVLSAGDPIDVDDVTAESRAAIDRALTADQDLIVCIEGLDGVGRRTLVAQAAAAFGRSVVALDAGRLAATPQQRAVELRAFRRDVWLRGAVPLIARLDAFARREQRPDSSLIELAEALEAPGAVQGPAFLTVQPGTELPEFRRRVMRLRVDAPAAPTRARIWARALGAPDGLPAAVAEVAQHYALTPGSIYRAAANAKLLAAGAAVDPEHVRAGVAAEIQERFGGLATRVVISQTWDDLILPHDTLDDVRAFTSRAAHASLVYDSWGFRRKLGRGLGLAALFSGPPGTGKTMVAGLIARSLGLEMYQVDLSQVVSKWVGETEKQLGRIFDAAAMGHALLLFDEADALFAKRTEVKSSNDRYANLEVNYLLQRIEQFGGVAVLTTNLETSVDPAFKRRLAADVRFYPPDREERERLWKTLFPESAPVEEGVDFGALAEQYKDMCGGHIRNAVLRAAFLAAADKTAIAQDHLNRAARSEYRAMGKVL